jgi:hypothetical protein
MLQCVVCGVFVVGLCVKRARDALCLRAYMHAGQCYRVHPHTEGGGGRHKCATGSSTCTPRLLVGGGRERGCRLASYDCAWLLIAECGGQSIATARLDCGLGRSSGSAGLFAFPLPRSLVSTNYLFVSFHVTYGLWPGVARQTPLRTSSLPPMRAGCMGCFFGSRQLCVQQRSVRQHRRCRQHHRRWCRVALVVRQETGALAALRHGNTSRHRNASSSTVAKCPPPPFLLGEQHSPPASWSRRRRSQPAQSHVTPHLTRCRPPGLRAFPYETVFRLRARR